MQMFRAARAIAVVLSLAGVVVFGSLLAFVQSSAQNFEARAQAFIIQEVEEQVGEAIRPLSPQLAGLAGKLSEQVLARQRALLAAVSDFVVATVGAMCRLDCEKQAELELALAEIFERRLAGLEIGLDKLRGIVEGRYRATLAEVRQDVVIFLVSNLAALGMVLALALVRGSAARHLLPIAIVLFASTLIGACWYVFGQNWLWTIMYSDYFGWAYVGPLAVLFTFLADIALNRARLTSEAFNIVAELVGGVPSWSPC